MSMIRDPFTIDPTPAPKRHCFNHRIHKKGCPACFQASRPIDLDDIDTDRDLDPNQGDHD